MHFVERHHIEGRTAQMIAGLIGPGAGIRRGEKSAAVAGLVGTSLATSLVYAKDKKEAKAKKKSRNQTNQGRQQLPRHE